VGYFAEGNYFYPSLRDQLNTEGDRILFPTRLTDLNKKWKFSILLWGDANNCTLRLYQLGFWFDFFLDFTSRRMCASLQGPDNGNTVSTVCYGNVAYGADLCQYPVPALAWMFYYVLGYNSTDYFDTATWQSVATYHEQVNVFGDGDWLPRIAFSYGIDESEKGMTLCMEIASHFNLAIEKTEDGKLSIVSLHRLQNSNDTYGYPALTHYGISIDDIIISGGKRVFKIEQTGNELLYNDVIVKYKRNNSTDEYASVYQVPDSYVLPESGLSIETKITSHEKG